MASREYAKPPAPVPPRLREAIARSSMIARADLVASVAHAAIGQRRADHVTPYIDHPRHAAELVLEWHERGIIDLDEAALERSVAATLLHDVLEDTKLPRAELRAHFPQEPRMLDLVEIMTEIEGDPDHPEYYGRIGADAEARIIKVADRCANLDDVIDDVKRGRAIDRWRRYLQKTRRDVEPLATGGLQNELRDRIATAQRVIEQKQPT